MSDTQSYTPSLAGQAHACRRNSQRTGNVRSNTTCGAAGERITRSMWLFLLLDLSCVWFRTLFHCAFARSVKLHFIMVQRDMTILSGKVSAGCSSHVHVCPPEHADNLQMVSFVSSSHTHSVFWFFVCYCWWNIRLPVVYFIQIESLVKSVGPAHCVSNAEITGDVQFCLKC